MIWCMRRTNIYLEERQTRALDRLADAEGTSRAEIIRRLIDRALDTGADRRNLLLAAIDASYATARSNPNVAASLGSGNVSGLSIAGLVAAAFLIFGRFGWLGKIAGAFLGMMLIGNNAGVFRTPETENVQRTRTPELPAEEQTHGGGMRR